MMIYKSVRWLSTNWKSIHVDQIIPSLNRPVAMQQFRIILDVRSPAEYQVDHIPGAVNLPILSNEEHKEVGTIYTQESQLKARLIGSCKIMANLIRHMGSDGILGQLFDNLLDNSKEQSKSQTNDILVYCKRGGQRSQSVAMVLSEIFQKNQNDSVTQLPTIYVLENGYRSFRSLVQTDLDELPFHISFMGICGLTGSGKTRVLRRLKQLGEHILDLESLAHHRGSLFGAWSIEQPSQKQFQTVLRTDLLKLASLPHQPIVWIECESRRIGSVCLPDYLWKNILAPASRYPRVVLKSSNRHIRVRNILEEYHHLTTPEHYEELRAILDRLYYLDSKSLSKEELDEDMRRRLKYIDNGQFYELVHDLLTKYYDTKYRTNRLHIDKIHPEIEIDNYLTDSYIDNVIYPQLKSLSSTLKYTCVHS